MHIRIISKHEEWPNQDPQSHHMILGVHSFTHFFLQSQYKKNIKIYLLGNLQKISDNVLWNQYFTATFLKDCYRFLAFQKGQENSFVKVGGRTFKLKELMEWENRYRVQAFLERAYRLSIESFLSDGSILVIDVDIGQKSAGDYDLVFEYKFYQEQQIARKTSRCESSTNLKKKRIQSSQSTAKRINNAKPNKTNYQSEKKPPKISNKPPNKHFVSSNPAYKLDGYQKSIATRKEIHTKLTKNAQQHKINRKVCYSQNSEGSSQDFDKLIKNFNNTGTSTKSGTQKFHKKQVHQNSQCTYAPSKLSIPGNYKKQKIVEHLLLKKQEQIRHYKQQLNEKQTKFAQQIQRIQQLQGKQIQSLKSQIQQILQNYKSKNKELKKQNECLNEANGQLLFMNKKLQNKNQQLSEQLIQQTHLHQNLTDQYQKIKCSLNQQKQAHQLLKQQMENRQLTNQNQMLAKEQEIRRIKGKYEELLGNIRKMAIGVSPSETKNKYIITEVLAQKQNIMF